jgi:dienelactone hydrolase
MAGEVAVLVADATPYVTAAVSAYGGAVLAKVRDDVADATVSLGRRLLQRVFGHTEEAEPLPAPLAALSADPADADAAAVVRWAMRQALEADATMLEEVRAMLASAQGAGVTQSIRAGRDAYVAGRDLTVNRADRRDG